MSVKLLCICGNRELSDYFFKILSDCRRFAGARKFTNSIPKVATAPFVFCFFISLAASSNFKSEIYASRTDISVI